MFIDIHNEFRDSREGFSELEELAYLAYGESEPLADDYRQWRDTDIAYALLCVKTDNGGLYRVQLSDSDHKQTLSSFQVLTRLQASPACYILNMRELTREETREQLELTDTTYNTERN